MATATPKKATDTSGAKQQQQSIKGLRHTDYETAYAGKVTQLDLLEQNFRLTAFTDQGQYPLGSLCTEIVWEEQSANVPTYANQDPPMTGSVTLTKPALSQYKTMLPEVFSAMVNPTTKSARYGALGVVMRLDYTSGADAAQNWRPLWAMRCLPADQQAADSVDIGEEGSWTINLADDLQLLSMSQAWFKFTKGKKTHQKGWLAHEIALSVCAEYGVPVKSLAQGTAYLDLPVSDTSMVSPLLMISSAYDGETAKTGKAYIVRWAEPDDTFPTGALEVVPFQRNSALLTFRKQIIDATLSRTINGDFATWVTAYGTVKQNKGKHKKLKYEARNEQAINRLGLVHKRVDFKSVSGMAELKILAKRQLAYDLSPIRGAEITNMGVATVRRGDAVQIDIPEEGYGDFDVAVSQVPASVNDKDSRHGKQNKQSLTTLQQAAATDPTIFGVPNIDALALKSAKNLEGSLNAATDVPIVVANQGIAFVSSVSHSLTPGNYSMDMVMSFVDILDPVDLQSEMDSNIRAAKLAAQAAASSKRAGSLGATGTNLGTISSHATQTPQRLAAAAEFLSNLKVPYPSPDSHAGANLNQTTYAGLYPPGLDCSSSTSWCLFQAGYPLPSGADPANGGAASGAYASWGVAGEGQYFTVWVLGGVHVFFEVKVGGHMQGNTVNPSGAGAGFRYFPWGDEDNQDAGADAAANGFVPRHFAGQ